MKKILFGVLCVFCVLGLSAPAMALPTLVTNSTYRDTFEEHRIVTTADTGVTDTNFDDTGNITFVNSVEVPVSFEASPGTGVTVIRVAGFHSRSDTIPKMTQDTYTIDFSTASETVLIATSDTGASVRATGINVKSMYNYLMIYVESTTETFVRFWIKE